MLNHFPWLELATRLSETLQEDGRLARGKVTRSRIFDAAERLFAERGFDGVSIRDIAAEADVTLGMVGFHGGSKEELFHVILERRVETLSARRLKALDDLRSERGPPKLRDIMAAYIAPYFEIADGGDPQWRAYARLIAGLASDERWLSVIQELYDPVATVFLDEIRALRPKADDERLTSVFVMMVTCMLGGAVSSGRIRGLALAARPTRPGEGYAELVIDFCTAGLEQALLTRRAPARTRASRKTDKRIR